MKRFFEGRKKILVLTALCLFCLLFIGCKSLDAKVFDNNGRFVLIKDNIPANSILLKSGELFDAGWIRERSGKIIPAQLYNLKTHKAELVGKLNIPRANYSQVLLNDGKILILGGQTVGKFGQLMKPVKMAEIYNPNTRTFSRISDMNYSRGTGTYCILLNDGRVFIISSGLAIAEIFDPIADKFTVVGDVKEYKFQTYVTTIPEGVAKYSTLNKFGIVKPVLLKDGRILLLGMSIDGGNTEIFNPKTNSFIPTGQMKYSRSQFTATLLNDGRVLVVGGVNKEHEFGIAPAEIFDPKTDSFTVTGALKNKRYDHSAILLSNGKVLIVNGTYGHGIDLKELKEAELFDPTTELFKKIGPSYGPRNHPQLINISKNQILIPYSYKSEIYKY